VSLGTAALG